jgi:GT2 family glycosyltransferase
MKYSSIQEALKNFSENDIPIVIPVFNTVSYLKLTMEQLEERGLADKVIVCDNDSQYPPMVEYLEELSKTRNVVLWGENLGPRVYSENKDICRAMPKYFIVTDPDLILNKDMPKNFIDKMKRIVDMYNVSKVGLAIEIYDPEERKRFFNADQVDRWERNYWLRKLEQYPEKDPVYLAPIDTTFVLYNRDKFLSEIDWVPGKMTCNTSAIRIAGRFTCQHMGWWKDQPLTEEEHEFYKNTHTWSSTENEKKRMGY